MDLGQRLAEFGSPVVAYPTAEGVEYRGAIVALHRQDEGKPEAGLVGVVQPLEFRELEPGVPANLDGVTVTPHEVRHPCGDPPLALRMDCGGKTITYSGDTEWCESLLSAAAGADLFIAEAYTYEKPIRFHLNFKTIEENREALAARRVVLTHMSADMLERVEALGWDYAEDGKVFRV